MVDEAGLSREAAHAIQQAVACIDLHDYCTSLLIRSSVEREFTINDQLVWGVIQDNLPARLPEAISSFSKKRPSKFSAKCASSRCRIAGLYEVPALDVEGKSPTQAES
ncbi:MAG: hypothetical protein ACNA8O_11330 [Cyanobacteriota bacterium]